MHETNVWHKKTGMSSQTVTFQTIRFFEGSYIFISHQSILRYFHIVDCLLDEIYPFITIDVVYNYIQIHKGPREKGVYLLYVRCIFELFWQSKILSWGP